MRFPRYSTFIEKENIQRVCFYHLVYAGRGSKLIEEDLSHEETPPGSGSHHGQDKGLFDKGHPVEVLTVDNHADGPIIYLRLLEEDPQRAAEVSNFSR